MMRAVAEIILMGAHFITDVREAYSPAEVCDLCSFGLTTLYAEIKAGRLRARKLGKKTLVLRSDLRAYLEALPSMTVLNKPDDHTHPSVNK
jgi:excisionase family DNA binding protein